MASFDEDKAERGSKPRNRSRDGAGKSDRSFIKHRPLRRAIRACVFKFDRALQKRAIRPAGKGICLVDANASDGIGVDEPQGDLWEPKKSQSTAEVAIQTAEAVGGDVILCEIDIAKRAVLKQRFGHLPNVTITSHHREAHKYLNERSYAYILWISDPCGPAGQGVQEMRDAAQHPNIDFVIVFNEGFVRNQLRGIKKANPDPRALASYRSSQRKYGWTLNYPEWARRLRRSRITVSRYQRQTARFNFRIFIVSNSPPALAGFEEIKIEKYPAQRFAPASAQPTT